MKKSLCSSCVFGQVIEGTQLHRHAAIDRSALRRKKEDDEYDPFPSFNYSEEDDEDEEEEEPVSLIPPIEIKEKEINISTTFCYFPIVPSPTSVLEKKNPVELSDHCITSCSRYKKEEIEV